MKKLLLLSVVLGTVSVANAQYYTTGQYSSIYYGGYPSAQASGRYILPPQQPVQPTIIPEAAQQPAIPQTTIQQPVYQQTYTQTQTYTRGYMPVANANADQVPAQYQSPVYDQEAVRKKFYFGLRLGYGQTRGWGHPFDDPSSFIVGGVLGMNFYKNFRADVELAYHFKDAIYEHKIMGENYKLDYSQYDIGINGYYDFHLGNSPVVPFVGLGAWLTNSKVSTKGTAWTVKASDDETNLAISAAAGLAFNVNDMLTLEGMLRARYIFCDGDIYNLEGLIGARFNF